MTNIVFILADHGVVPMSRFDELITLKIDEGGRPVSLSVELPEEFEKRRAIVLSRTEVLQDGRIGKVQKILIAGERKWIEDLKAEIASFIQQGRVTIALPNCMAAADARRQKRRDGNGR